MLKPVMLKYVSLKKILVPCFLTLNPQSIFVILDPNKNENFEIKVNSTRMSFGKNDNIHHNGRYLCIFYWYPHKVKK